MADTLDEDAVIVEGYAEYATWRPHLAYLRDPYGDPDMEMEIDGVGGVSILAKAKVFRAGVHFPAFSFEKHAETEGFGKVGALKPVNDLFRMLTVLQMAKRMKFSVIGLPHYTIWHLYEPSVDDVRHMEEMEQERKRKEEQERQERERVEKIKEQFDDPKGQWDRDKDDIKDMAKKEIVEKAVEKAEEEAEAKKVEAKKAIDENEKRGKEGSGVGEKKEGKEVTGEGEKKEDKVGAGGDEKKDNEAAGANQKNDQAGTGEGGQKDAAEKPADG